MRNATIALVALWLVPGVSTAQDIPVSTLRAAAQNGLTLLVQTSPTFVKKGGCNSCHNQMLPAAAQAFVRSRGIPAGELLVQLPAEVSEATTERYVEYSVGGGGGVNAIGFELFAASLAGRAADARTIAEIHFLKGMQQPEGFWRGGGNRPPLTFDDFTPTAYVVRALSAYAPAVDAADTKARIDRARLWLQSARAERTQERAFQVLGLVWSKAGRDSIEAAVRGLEGLQQSDGGWSQLPDTTTDAYATGMALYAMSEAGVSASHPAYQAGLKFLVSTQAADGTWHVKTRALPFQPYFESGYPYEHDQWISAAGAAYATMAIAAAVEPSRPDRR